MVDPFIFIREFNKIFESSYLMGPHYLGMAWKVRQRERVRWRGKGLTIFAVVMLLGIQDRIFIAAIFGIEGPLLSKPLTQC